MPTAGKAPSVEPRADRERIHLFRGAPAVRAWSEYQETMKQWTLCGIRRKSKTPVCTEHERLVNCRYCLEMIGKEAN